MPINSIIRVGLVVFSLKNPIFLLFNFLNIFDFLMNKEIIKTINIKANIKLIKIIDKTEIIDSSDILKTLISHF